MTFRNRGGELHWKPVCVVAGHIGPSVFTAMRWREFQPIFDRNRISSLIDGGCGPGKQDGQQLPDHSGCRRNMKKISALDLLQKFRK